MIASLLLALAAPALQDPGGGFEALAEEVRFRRLENGLRVVVLPFGQAPAVAFRLHVRVGSMDEELGLTGLAHFAEHMAFKGSRRIGALDWPRERRLLEACDRAWAAYEEALSRPGPERDPEALEALRAEFEEARQAADALSDLGAFDRAVEEAGGADQNATTGADSTRYFVSLPANRTEQWFWLAREQVGAPVMREFYKERDVVMEERRLRTDSSAWGATLEALTNAAFVAHPYRDSTIGHMDDLEHLDRPEMQAFWRRHYTADRMVLAVVGRVEPDEIFALAERYLGDLPAGRGGRPRRTAEPPQPGPREVRVVRPAAPLLLAGWHTPAQTGRSALVYEALGDILAEGPSSRLYRRLVKEEGAAAEIGWTTGFPGRVDPCLFLFYAYPAPGRSPRECLDLAQEEIGRFAAEGPTGQELEGVRRRAKRALLDSLEDGAGLAAALAEAEAEDGGWETLFHSLEVMEGLSAADLQEAAGRLVAQGRTVAWLLPPGSEPDTRGGEP